MSEKPVLFLSIRRVHIQKILCGEKTAELRRVRPRLADGISALLYETSPTMALVGSCMVSEVVSLPLSELWRTAGKRSAVLRSEFDDYFRGKDTGHALILSEVTRLSTPVPISRLREAYPGFIAPQSFRYFLAPTARKLAA